MENKTTDNGKTVAIIAYITLIGWIVALIMNKEKTEFGSYHIRQALGIMCTGVILILAVGLIDIWILNIVVEMAIFVLWLLGLIAAVQGEMKPVPVLGEKFQEWFSGI